MSFVQREIDRLMKICQQSETESPIYQAAYAAKQALSWALEPDGLASPSSLMDKFYGAKTEGTKARRVS